MGRTSREDSTRKLVYSPEEKEGLLEAADFRLRGVGPKGIAKVKRLLRAIETTPPDARLGEVLAAKMGPKGVARSTYQAALQLARLLEPCPLIEPETQTTRPGSPISIGVNWPNVSLWATRATSVDPEASENNRRPPKIIGGLRFPDGGVGGVHPSSVFRNHKYKAHDHDHEYGLLEKSEGWKGQWWGFDEPLTNEQLRDAAMRRRLFRYAVDRGKRLDTKLLEVAFHALCLCCAEHGWNGGGGRLLTANVFGKASYRPSDAHYEIARRELLELSRESCVAADLPAVRQLVAATSIPAEPAPPRQRTIVEQMDLLAAKIHGS